MEELAEYNIQKNFTDVPTFLKFLRTSTRQVMISRLSNSAFQGQVSLD
jgi:hypothetical protein